MYTCLIIDDDRYFIDALSEYINNMNVLRLIGSYTNPLKALEQITAGEKPDIIFLDVDMPELSGIHVAQLLPKSIAVIFITGHSKYAIEAFELDVFDFLLKPFNYVTFFKYITKVLERSGRATIEEDIQSIFINPGTKGKIVQITISQISHIEALDHYVCIYLPSEKIVTKINLKEIQAKLPSSIFVRVHRSFLVNIDLIQSVNSSEILLINSFRIPFGDSYKRRFLEKIQHKTLGLT